MQVRAWTWNAIYWAPQIKIKAKELRNIGFFKKVHHVKCMAGFADDDAAGKAKGLLCRSEVLAWWPCKTSFDISNTAHCLWCVIIFKTP